MSEDLSVIQHLKITAIEQLGKNFRSEVRRKLLDWNLHIRNKTFIRSW